MGLTIYYHGGPGPGGHADSCQLSSAGVQGRHRGSPSPGELGSGRLSGTSKGGSHRHQADFLTRALSTVPSCHPVSTLYFCPLMVIHTLPPSAHWSPGQAPRPRGTHRHNSGRQVSSPLGRGTDLTCSALLLSSGSVDCGSSP